MVGYSQGAHKDSNMTKRPNTTRNQKRSFGGSVTGSWGFGDKRCYQLQKMHNMRTVSFTFIGGFTKDYSQGTASQIALRNCSKEVGQYIWLGEGI